MRSEIEMINSKDYYKLLEIDRSATEDIIKKAYRKRAMEFHPDVNTDKDAEETFKAISEAYTVLSDRQKRYIYDQTGTTNFSGFGATMNRPHPRGRGMGRCMGKCSGFEGIFRRRHRYASKPTEPPGSIAE